MGDCWQVSGSFRLVFSKIYSLTSIEIAADKAWKRHPFCCSNNHSWWRPEYFNISATSDLTSFFIKLSDECFPPCGRAHTSGAGDLVRCQHPAWGAGTRVIPRSHSRQEADMSAGAPQAVIFPCKLSNNTCTQTESKKSGSLIMWPTKWSASADKDEAKTRSGSVYSSYLLAAWLGALPPDPWAEGGWTASLSGSPHATYELASHGWCICRSNTQNPQKW